MVIDMKSQKILRIICIILTSSIFFNYLFLSSSTNANSTLGRFDRRNDNNISLPNISPSIFSPEMWDKLLAIDSCQKIIDEKSDWKEIENNLYILYSIIYEQQNRESDSRFINFSRRVNLKVRIIDYFIQKSNSIEEKDCSKILEVSYPTNMEIAKFIEETSNLSKDQ